MHWCSPVNVLTADELLGLMPGGPKLLPPARGVLSEVGSRGIRGSPGGLLLAAEGLVGSLWWACSQGHIWKLGLQHAHCSADCTEHSGPRLPARKHGWTAARLQADWWGQCQALTQPGAAACSA